MLHLMCKFAQQFMADKTIKLTYLALEWDILEKEAKTQGSKDFRSYLTRHLYQLARECGNISLKDNRIEKKSVNFFIPPEICEALISFSRHRNIPLASIIAWYVADPILKSHFMPPEQ